MGKLIVFDGLDGSGKETQSKILKESLDNKNFRVKRVEYPNYGSLSSSLVRLYLDGFIDKNPFDVNAYATSSFYASDHYISFVKEWKEEYENDYIIIADRYVSSNIIHQMAKLKEKEWESFLNWLYDYEFKKLKLPKEDILIYLDVDVKISSKLIEKRNLKKDIHEKNLFYLEKCRDAAFFAAEKLNWKIIRCYENGEMLEKKEIAKKVSDLVLEII